MSITIAINYYNNITSLKRVLDCFREISSELPGFFEFVIVDDHSPSVPDLGLFDGIPNFRLYRVLDDVAWNMPGARNVCALEARSKHILFMDIDHLIEKSELGKLVRDSEMLGKGTRLTPSRTLASGPNAGDQVKPNINCFLIHRSDFFRAGGYEEDFSGSYGQEDKYFKYCCKWNGILDQKANFSLSVVPGASTKLLDRDKSKNEKLLDELINTKIIKAKNAFRYSYDRII
jgi:glycosyltransferase involved in cell wall biosynthesis